MSTAKAVYLNSESALLGRSCQGHCQQDLFGRKGPAIYSVQHPGCPTFRRLDRALFLIYPVEKRNIDVVARSSTDYRNRRSSTPDHSRCRDYDPEGQMERSWLQGKSQLSRAQALIADQFLYPALYRRNSESSLSCKQPDVHSNFGLYYRSGVLVVCSMSDSGQLVQV